MGSMTPPPQMNGGMLPYGVVIDVCSVVERGVGLCLPLWRRLLLFRIHTRNITGTRWSTHYRRSRHGGRSRGREGGSEDVTCAARMVFAFPLGLSPHNIELLHGIARF